MRVCNRIPQQRFERREERAPRVVGCKLQRHSSNEVNHSKPDPRTEQPQYKKKKKGGGGGNERIVIVASAKAIARARVVCVCVCACVCVCVCVLKRRKALVFSVTRAHTNKDTR